MRLVIFQYIIIFVLLFFLFPTVGQSQEIPFVSANNAILMETNSGRVLYEKQAHERQSIASITKIMTAIIAIEQGNMDDSVSVSDRAIRAEGSSIYLQKNEKISLEDLLYGLMLRSGNDAAIAIAEHIGGSVEGFVFLMNEKAKYLGMTNTHFANPHGLDEENHFSTAYDMAVLMRYANENEVFQKISRSDYYISDNRTYKWKNKNKLLTQFYHYCTGGKTGFTKKAGRTLVTTAKKDNLSLIAVTLNAPNDWNDHTSMFEWGFNEFELVMLDKKGKRTFVSEETFITGYIKDDTLFPLRTTEYDEIYKRTILNTAPPNNHLSKIKIGTIIYTLDGEEILEIPVYDQKIDHDRLYAKLKNIIKKIVRFDTNG